MRRSIVFTTSKPGSLLDKTIAMTLEGQAYTCVNLSSMHFSDYDPAGENYGDDFLAMAEQMVQYDNIILACPVYWYGVPALMKRFIDRWSDLLTHRKDIGRKLEGKKMYVIANYGTYPDGYEGFEAPLQKTSTYMSMKYGGALLYYTGPDVAGLRENLVNLEIFHSQLTD